MRSYLLFIIFSCITCYACTPKNEEVTEEQVQADSVDELQDTLVNTKIDGTLTDDDPVPPTFPLPQPVLQLLTNKYPKWQDPTYTALVMQQAKDNIQGPGIVRGDFNGDKLQDYALQLQQEKQLLIVAVLDKTNDNWQVEEIRKDTLFNDQGTYKSPYLLQLINANTAVKHTGTGKEITTSYDAVALSIKGNTTAYLFENGKFEPYRLVK